MECEWGGRGKGGGEEGREEGREGGRKQKVKWVKEHTQAFEHKTNVHNIILKVKKYLTTSAIT